MFGTFSWIWWVAAVAGAGVIVSVLVLIGRWARRRWWRNRFVTAFSFDPGATWIERGFQKPEVDRVLKYLAHRFNNLVGHENKLVERSRKEGATEGLEDLERYRSVHAELLAAKKEFWATHNTAQHAGFDVEEKYTDYLK